MGSTTEEPWQYGDHELAVIKRVGSSGALEYQLIQGYMKSGAEAGFLMPSKRVSDNAYKNRREAFTVCLTLPSALLGAGTTSGSGKRPSTAGLGPQVSGPPSYRSCAACCRAMPPMTCGVLPTTVSWRAHWMILPSASFH